MLVALDTTQHFPNMTTFSSVCITLLSPDVERSPALSRVPHSMAALLHLLGGNLDLWGAVGLVLGAEIVQVCQRQPQLADDE